MNSARREEILGVKVDLGLDLEEVMTKIEKDFLVGSGASEKYGRLICTTNPEFIIDANKDPEFKNMINTADMSLPDGTGVILADYYLRIMKNVSMRGFFPKFLLPIAGVFAGIRTGVEAFNGSHNLATKITGVRLSEEICRLSAEKGYSVFFLGGMTRDWKGTPKVGGAEDVAKLAADRMRSKYPGVKIVGASSQYSYDVKDDEKTISYIKECMSSQQVDSLDFILVAYGHKKQESWIKRNAGKIPCKLGVGVGGTFDYLSGVSKKPNDKISQMNLEWLYRLCTQPWRISRIFKAFPTFPLKVFFSSFF